MMKVIFGCAIRQARINRNVAAHVPAAGRTIPTLSLADHDKTACAGRHWTRLSRLRVPSRREGKLILLIR